MSSRCIALRKVSALDGISAIGTQSCRQPFAGISPSLL
jgi:hypothetical protein